jgi:hypothetical protein
MQKANKKGEATAQPGERQTRDGAASSAQGGGPKCGGRLPLGRPRAPSFNPFPHCPWEAAQPTARGLIGPL